MKIPVIQIHTVNRSTIPFRVSLDISEQSTQLTLDNSIDTALKLLKRVDLLTKKLSSRSNDLEQESPNFAPKPN